MPYESFGIELDERRSDLGYTREQIAEILDCGVLILYKLSNEVIDSMYYFWTIEQFIKYCKLLNVDHMEYLKRSIFLFKYYPKMLEFFNVNYEEILAQRNSDGFNEKIQNIQMNRKKHFSSRKEFSKKTRITKSSIRQIEVNFPHGIVKSRMIDVVFYFYHIQLLPYFFSLDFKKS